MKAVRIDGQTPGGKRAHLAEVLPIDTPFSVQVFPIYACNLTCSYCIHSVPLKERGYITDQTVMNYALYKKCINDMTGFSNKLKMLRFAGTGEPLLHKDLAKMVAYAVEKNVADSIDIVTNGVLLTPLLSKELVNAGVTKIRISIQGVRAEAYQYVSKKEGFFQEFLGNLKFLYEHRGKTQIYIKVIDCALEDGDKEKFFAMFGDICDFIAIEHLIPAVEQIDYEKISKHNAEFVTQNGAELQSAEVCPQPFYFMQINPDGKIVPCCAMKTSYIAGDANIENLCAIWNGKKFNGFRKKQLQKEKSIYPVCKQCRQYRYMMFLEDMLDYEAERLLNTME